jgi:phosphatidylinositol-4,5-bisphosphate 3-kinase
LVKQTSITDQLTTVANAIKGVADQPKRKQILDRELTSLKLYPYFVVTTNPAYALLVNVTNNIFRFVGKGFIKPKCKYMQSKTLPLWLVFENVDPLGDSIYAILKSGDDLRQDQLVLQMFQIFDQMWIKAALDLKVFL